jgi:hypothetical protein
MLDKDQIVYVTDGPNHDQPYYEKRFDGKWKSNAIKQQTKQYKNAKASDGPVQMRTSSNRMVINLVEMSNANVHQCKNDETYRRYQIVIIIKHFSFDTSALSNNCTALQ